MSIIIEREIKAGSEENPKIEREVVAVIPEQSGIYQSKIGEIRAFVSPVISKDNSLKVILYNPTIKVARYPDDNPKCLVKIPLRHDYYRKPIPAVRQIRGGERFLFSRSDCVNEE